MVPCHLRGGVDRLDGPLGLGSEDDFCSKEAPEEFVFGGDFWGAVVFVRFFFGGCICLIVVE